MSMKNKSQLARVHKNEKKIHSLQKFKNSQSAKSTHSLEKLYYFKFNFSNSVFIFLDLLFS